MYNMDVGIFEQIACPEKVLGTRAPIDPAGASPESNRLLVEEPRAPSLDDQSSR